MPLTKEDKAIELNEPLLASQRDDDDDDEVEDDSGKSSGKSSSKSNKTSKKPATRGSDASARHVQQTLNVIAGSSQLASLMVRVGTEQYKKQKALDIQEDPTIRKRKGAFDSVDVRMRRNRESAADHIKISVDEALPNSSRARQIKESMCADLSPSERTPDEIWQHLQGKPTFPHPDTSLPWAETRKRMAELKAKARSLYDDPEFRYDSYRIGKAATYRRLQMVKDAGLPPLRFLPANALRTERADGVAPPEPYRCEEHCEPGDATDPSSYAGLDDGYDYRIPRSDEGKTVDGVDIMEVFRGRANERAALIFVSHRWFYAPNGPLRNQTEPWDDRPDYPDHRKARMLWEFAEFLRNEARFRSIPHLGIPTTRHLHVFFWIDYCCIDQALDVEMPCFDDKLDDIKTKRDKMFPILVPYMISLSIYASCCHVFLCNEGKDLDYNNRVWCTLERAVGYATCLNGAHAFVIREGFVYDPDSSYSQIRTESRTLVSPEEKIVEGEEHLREDVRLLVKMLKGKRRLFLTFKSNEEGFDNARPYPRAVFAVLTLLAIVFTFGFGLPFLFLAAYDGARSVRWGNVVDVRVLEGRWQVTAPKLKDKRRTLLLSIFGGIIGILLITIFVIVVAF